MSVATNLLAFAGGMYVLFVFCSLWVRLGIVWDQCTELQERVRKLEQSR